MKTFTAFCALCLLALVAHAQPSRDDIIRAQHEVLDRLAPLTFIRTTEIGSFDKQGRLKVSAAYVRRYVSLDDGTLHTQEVSPTLGLYGVTLTRMDADARFLPVFVTTASRVTYEREDGALYVMKVERVSGIFGFEGKLWVTHNGFVSVAEGRCVPKGLKRGERPLRFTYRARPASYLPAELVEEDVVGGRRVRVVSRFADYRRFRSEEPRVIEEGEGQTYSGFNSNLRPPTSTNGRHEPKAVARSRRRISSASISVVIRDNSSSSFLV